MSFYIDCAERSCWTKVFARTATDTLLCIDGWNLLHVSSVHSVAVCVHPEAIFRMALQAPVGRYHLYGSCRTVLGAIAAVLSVGERNAVLFNPDGMPDLDGCLFFFSDRADCACWANVRATCAFWTAIALVVLHFWLQECLQLLGGAEHSVRTVRYTELTSRAVLLQVSCGQRTWRCDGCSSLRNLLVFDFCQSAVCRFLLCFDGGCCQCRSCDGEERTT